MRLSGLPVLLGALLLALPAHAQESAAERSGEIADVPSGPATLRGRIVHPDRPAAAAGMTVVLYALPTRGVPGLRQATADANGDFAFEGISNDPHTAYLIGTRHAGVPFGQRVVFAPGERERSVELRISDPIADAGDVSVGEATLRIDWLGRRLRVTETYQLQNSSERVVFVPEPARGRSAPALRAALPEGALRFAPSLGSPELVWTRSGLNLALWGPVYPGAHTVSFAYDIPVSPPRAELTKRFPSGAKRVRVLALDGGPAVTVDGLDVGEPVTLERGSYRALEGADVAAGTRLVVVVEIPEASSDLARLSVPRVRIFLELDDAALIVNEEHHFAVEGGAALVPADGEALLRVGLPAGASGLRLGADSFALGAGLHPAGGIAVQGPLPAGASTLTFRYHLPVEAVPVDFRREFPETVSLLSIFLTDTGVLVETQRMHRQRPVRTPDRTYLHLEAFEIASGEAVSLELSPLSPRSGASPWATWSFALAAVAGAVWFLAAPLRGPPEEAPSDAGALSATELESIYATIHDLDHDFETGKLEEGDYHRLRDELRLRAVALLREERARAARPAPESAPPPEARGDTCAECGAPVGSADRFCSRCGGRLDGAAPAGAPPSSRRGAIA